MHTWANNLLMVWVMISPLSSFACELVPRLEEEAAPLPYVSCQGCRSHSGWLPIRLRCGRFSRRHWPWRRLGGSGDVGRDDFCGVAQGLACVPTANCCGLVMLRTFLVRSLALALQTSLLMTCPMAKGTDSVIGFGGRDDSRRETCAEDLCWDIGSGESPKGFPHAVAWVSVEFGHPSPVLVPSTTWSRGSVGGREFDGEQELAEEALLCLLR